MQEKILNHKKNGFAMLFLIILLYAAGIGVFVLGVNLLDEGAGAPGAADSGRLYLDGHRLDPLYGT